MNNYWSQEEIDYLYEHVGGLRVELIAKKLNRPIGGVSKKMRELNLSITRKQTGHLTIGELAQLLRVDRKTVENWAFNHGLPYKKRKTRAIKTYYFIDPLLFWEWAVTHKNRIDFSKIEPHSIPPEPDWVDKLRVEKNEVIGNYYRPWTKKEEEQVFLLRQKGNKYKEIADMINRTPMSVEKKYKRILDEKMIDIS
jgi:Myb-like DNA-binding domain